MPRPIAALAMLLALACAAAPDARAQATAQRPPPLPSGGPAAAHAHPRAPGQPGRVAKPQAVVVPAVPPAPPVLPPPIVVPTRPPPPPAPTPVATDAPGTASRTEDGLRVTFGAGRSDINPGSDTAITELAHAAAGPGASFSVTAYAAGGDDPSAPRRLSLSRALAVRSALLQAGIASVRIYVKAFGASAPSFADGPPDRVDIVVTVPPAPAQPAPGAAPAAPPPTQKAAP